MVVAFGKSGTIIKVKELINKIVKDSNKVNRILGKYVDMMNDEEKIMIGNTWLFKLSAKVVDHYFDVNKVYGKDDKEKKL